MVTSAKRKSNNAWDKANMTVLGCARTTPTVCGQSAPLTGTLLTPYYGTHWISI